MKKKFQINPKTLVLEEVEYGIGYWLRQSGLYILGGIILGIIFLFLFLTFFPSPREKQLLREKEALQSQLSTLNQQVDQMQLVMVDLQQRDDNLYRVLFGAEPIPLSIRQGTQRKISYYEELARMTNNQLSADLSLKVDILEKEIYVQSKSYDDIIAMAKNQEIRMENIPAIQPVLNKDLTRVASGYGMRIDPVYHVRKFHQGMDFTAPTGTEVFATGNAKVKFSGWKQGYGNTIILDHGFGYETLYAHLSKKLVGANDNVKAGDPIGIGGNTGRSSGPHLHFETLLLGSCLDPALLFDFKNQDVTGDFYLYRRPGSKYIENGIVKIAGPEKKYHKVKSGETIGKIARKYNVEEGIIFKLNKLNSRSIIRPGQMLRYQ
jgi:murein DD-endopeptidase MepM/ murein hydrolase activator NlpD